MLHAETLPAPDHVLAAPSHPDPYPYYATLVAGPPLVFDATRKFWIASSAAVVSEVLRHPACRVRPVGEPVPAAIAGAAAGEVFGQLVRMNDGARHHLPKLVLQRFIAGADLQRVRARTTAIALREAKAEQACLSQWTFNVPVMAVADWLGFDEAALPKLARWAGDFVACLSPLSSPAQLAAASVAAEALLAAMADLVSASVSRPGSVVATVQADAQSTGWADQRALLANLVGLLSQTYEATAGLLGNSIVALVRQPGLRGTLGREPAQWLALVNEVSRHDPGIHNTRRYLAQDTRIAGMDLRAGDAVLLVLAAAGRDPACNPLPDHFWLARPDRVVPGFGQGAHQCPGQALACTIAAAALQALPAGQPPARWHYRASVNTRIPVFADGLPAPILVQPTLKARQ